MNWRTIVNGNDENSNLMERFMDMLRVYAEMRHGYFRKITSRKHCIDLLNKETTPIHNYHFRLRTRSRELENTDVNSMLKESLAKPLVTECLLAIVLAKRVRAVEFCMEFRSLSRMGRKDSYLIPEVVEYTETGGAHESTLIWTLMGDMRRLNLTKVAARTQPSKRLIALANMHRCCVSQSILW